MLEYIENCNQLLLTHLHEAASVIAGPLLEVAPMWEAPEANKRGDSGQSVSEK